MASKRALRWRECRRKRQFPSLYAARKAAEFYHRFFTGELHAYACRFCQAWHVGHIPFPEHRTRREHF
jgi:hypothetical protein